MNDMNDPNQTQPVDPSSAGFCQNCGRPLTNDTVRKVGSAVFCEPCLSARIGATPGAGPGSVPPPPGYGPVNTGFRSAWTAQNLGAPGPNPGLAALLGLIPGVGAMYNEQYAKGVVHLIVFAVLVSLSDNVNGIFGLFVAGWVFYMAIEAHHTARARRDGTPLPNPFGLNDIGERLGFGKSWPTGPTVTEVANDAAAAASQGFNSTIHQPQWQSPFQSAPNPYPPGPAPEPWGAPVDTHATYAQASAYDATAYTQNAQAYPPPMPPYSAMPTYGTPLDPATFAPPVSRFPAGAVWLIGLGTVFLLTTTGIFNGFPAEALVGCVVFGAGIWVFLRRMLDTGVGFQNDGSPGYGLRVLRALRGSVWLGLIGILFLLDAFHLVTWRHSWPFLLILAGVMSLIERILYQSPANYMPQTPPTAAPPVTMPHEPTDSNQGSV